MQVRGFASAYSARGLVGEYSVAVQRKLRGASGESQRVLQSAKPTQAEQGVPVCRWMTARPLLNMPYPGILFCVGICAWRALFLRPPSLASFDTTELIQLVRMQTYAGSQRYVHSVGFVRGKDGRAHSEAHQKPDNMGRPVGAVAIIVTLR